MRNKPGPPKTVVATLLALAVVTTPAHAFRCGNKIVSKDMHEAQVVRACGTPTTMRNIGRTLRHINIPIESNYGGGWTARHFPGYGFSQEVVITEYVYNFGPRKLMRRLLFEGGVLVSIETLGYGYLE
jgi:hypothetical protein